MDYDDNDAIPSAPPPSYDDVVAAGPSLVVPLTPPPAPTPNAPSFPPPPSAIRQQAHQRPPQRSGPGAGSRQGSRQQLPRQQSRTSSNSSMHGPPRQRQHSHRPSGSREPPTRQMRQQHFLEKLSNFNMAFLMLKAVTLSSPDVDLDSEAHLPNRQSLRKKASRIKRIKCICCGLWFCGFTLLFFLLALPVAMFLTGVFGYNRCPHNSRLIISLLMSISAMFFVTLLLRLFNSALSCCKIGNFCNSEKSVTCSACIGIMEGCFLVFVALTTILTLMGTWFILSNPPSLNSADANYCDSGVYYGTLIMIGLLYLFCFCLILYLVAAAVSYCSYQDDMAPRRRVVKTNVRRQPRPRRHDDVLF